MSYYYYWDLYSGSCLLAALARLAKIYGLYSVNSWLHARQTSGEGTGRRTWQQFQARSFKLYFNTYRCCHAGLGYSYLEEEEEEDGKWMLLMNKRPRARSDAF